MDEREEGRREEREERKSKTGIMSSCVGVGAIMHQETHGVGKADEGACNHEYMMPVLILNLR